MTDDTEHGIWWRTVDGVEQWLPRGSVPAWDGVEGAPLDISALVEPGPVVRAEGWMTWRVGPEPGGGAWYTTPNPRRSETRPPFQGPTRTYTAPRC